MSGISKSTSRPRIAIVGATGRVGRPLVAGLAQDPVDLVALTRDAGAGRVPDGVAVAEVDFAKAASLASVLEGADRLFLAHGTSDRQVENEIAVIDAAVRAGVSHIVKLSALGPPTQLHPFDWHMTIEAHLAGQPIGYTVLRPGPFVDVLARAQAPVAQGMWGGTAGDGLVNLIDTRDIADVARIALLDDRFIGAQRAYHLTGPQPVTMPGIAEALSAILGRPVVYHHRTHDAHRAVLLASGASAMVADLLLGLDRLFREGILAETTTTVAELTGRAARSAVDWLRENAALFQPSGAAAAR